MNREVKKEQRKMIAALGLGYFINTAQELSLPQVFPAMRSSFTPALTNANLADIDGIRILIQTALTPIWGLLADRYSRKWVLVIGTGFWGTLIILCGLSRSYNQLLVSWVVAMLGLGALVPAGFNMLADLYPPHQRGTAIGVLNALGMLGIVVFGAACNPLLGLFPREGWRYLMIGAGLLSLLVGILLLALIREPVRGSAEPELSELAADLAASRFRFRPADVREVLGNKTVWVAFFQGFFMLTSLYTLTKFFPTWLVDERGFKEENAPLVFGGVVISLAVGSIFGGMGTDWADRKWPRYGRAAISQLSLLLIILSQLILFQAVRGAAGVILVTVFMAFFLEWTRRGALQPLIQNVVRPELRGTALALAEFFQGGTASLMVMGFGRYADKFGLTRAFLLGGTGFAALAFFMAFAFHFTYPHDLARLRAAMQHRREILLKN